MFQAILDSMVQVQDWDDLPKVKWIRARRGERAAFWGSRGWKSRKR